MRKQWIPGHFSLLPRGLGTRLGARLHTMYIHKTVWKMYMHKVTVPDSESVKCDSPTVAHRVVTLVAYKLERQLLWEVYWYKRLIVQGNLRGSCSVYLNNHDTLTTLRTSLKELVSTSRWYPHRCSEGCQYVVVVKWTGLLLLMFPYAISL